MFYRLGKKKKQQLRGGGNHPLFYVRWLDYTFLLQLIQQDNEKLVKVTISNLRIK